MVKVLFAVALVAATAFAAKESVEETDPGCFATGYCTNGQLGVKAAVHWTQSTSGGKTTYSITIETHKDAKDISHITFGWPQGTTYYECGSPNSAKTVSQDGSYKEGALYGYKFESNLPSVGNPKTYCMIADEDTVPPEVWIKACTGWAKDIQPCNAPCTPAFSATTPTSGTIFDVQVAGASRTVYWATTTVTCACGKPLTSAVLDVCPESDLRGWFGYCNIVDGQIVGTLSLTAQADTPFSINSGVSQCTDDGIYDRTVSVCYAFDSSTHGDGGFVSAGSVKFQAAGEYKATAATSPVECSVEPTPGCIPHTSTTPHHVGSVAFQLLSGANTGDGGRSTIVAGSNSYAAPANYALAADDASTEYVLECSPWPSRCIGVRNGEFWNWYSDAGSAACNCAVDFDNDCYTVTTNGGSLTCDILFSTESSSAPIVDFINGPCIDEPADKKKKRSTSSFPVVDGNFYGYDEGYQLALNVPANDAQIESGQVWFADDDTFFYMAVIMPWNGVDATYGKQDDGQRRDVGWDCGDSPHQFKELIHSDNCELSFCSSTSQKFKISHSLAYLYEKYASDYPDETNLGWLFIEAMNVAGGKDINKEGFYSDPNGKRDERVAKRKKGNDDDGGSSPSDQNKDLYIHSAFEYATSPVQNLIDARNAALANGASQSEANSYDAWWYQHSPLYEKSYMRDSSACNGPLLSFDAYTCVNTGNAAEDAACPLWEPRVVYEMKWLRDDALLNGLKLVSNGSGGKKLQCSDNDSANTELISITAVHASPPKRGSGNVIEDGACTATSCGGEPTPEPTSTPAPTTPAPTTPAPTIPAGERVGVDCHWYIADYLALGLPNPGDNVDILSYTYGYEFNDGQLCLNTQGANGYRPVGAVSEYVVDTSDPTTWILGHFSFSFDVDSISRTSGNGLCEAFVDVFDDLDADAEPSSSFARYVTPDCASADSKVTVNVAVNDEVRRVRVHLLCRDADGSSNSKLDPFRGELCVSNMGITARASANHVQDANFEHYNNCNIDPANVPDPNVKYTGTGVSWADLGGVNLLCDGPMTATDGVFTAAPRVDVTSKFFGVSSVSAYAHLTFDSAAAAAAAVTDGFNGAEVALVVNCQVDGQWKTLGQSYPAADATGKTRSVSVKYTVSGGKKLGFCTATVYNALCAGANVNKNVVVTELSLAESHDACHDGGDDTTTYGDPHMTTLDGLHYDMQAVGDFVLTQDHVMTVHTRTARAGPFASVNEAAAVNAFRRTVQLHRAPTTADGSTVKPTLIVDGHVRPYLAGTTMALWGPGGVGEVGTVVVSGKLASIVDPLRFRVSFPETQHEVNIYVYVSSYKVQFLEIVAHFPESSRGLTSGLLGNFDGVASNDIRTRDGVEFRPAADGTYDHTEMYAQFASSWRTSNPANKLKLFSAGVADVDESFPPRGDWRSTFTSAQLVAAEKACQHNEKESRAALDACIFDVLMMDDVAMADMSAAARRNAQQEYAGRYFDAARSSSNDDSDDTGAIIAVVVVCSVAAVIVIAFAAFYAKRRYDKANAPVETVPLDGTATLEADA
jgi:hypothetical protein